MTLPTAPILIDTRWIGDHGIGRFAREVIARLDLDWVPVPETIPLLSPLEPLALSRLIRRVRPSAYFSPGFNPPLFSAVPTVFCLHDLIHLHVPEYATPARRLYYTMVVKRAMHSARRILTVSEFSRQEILVWSGVSPDRVVVVCNGVSEDFTAQGPCHTPGYTYLFAIGNPKPHKNIPRLIQALAKADIPVDTRLLISGPEYPEWTALIQSLGLGQTVVCAGHIPEPSLPAYYRGALAVVVPSLYEGFGLPVLEAMACGTPVLVARATALPEAGGDAVLYCDPLDMDSMAAGIAAIVRDDATRSSLRELGLKRVRGFSWNNVVNKINNILVIAIA